MPVPAWCSLVAVVVKGTSTGSMCLGIFGSYLHFISIRHSKTSVLQQKPQPCVVVRATSNEKQSSRAALMDKTNAAPMC